MRSARLCFLCLIVSCLFFLQYPLLSSVSAQTPPCDPALKSTMTDTFGYRLREDRCEGRYVEEVANKVLSVASLTESFERYDLDSGKDLFIAWTVPRFRAKECQIQARGLKEGLFYQMDTRPALKHQLYRWPITLLKALDVSREKMGILGWTWCTINKKQEKVYLPLRIKQQHPSGNSPCYQVTLWPGYELTEVYLTLAPVLDRKGRLGEYLKDEIPLGFGYYPAKKRINIPISNLQGPGIYYLSIAATKESGGAVELELYFYHAG